MRSLALSCNLRRRLILVVAGLIVLANVVLARADSANHQLGVVASSLSHVNPSASVEEVASSLGADGTTDPRQDGLIGAQPALQRIFDAHPKSFGGVSWDMAAQTLTVRVVGSVRDPESDASSLANDVRTAALPITVTYAAAPRSRAELDEALQAIVETKSTWAAGLAGFSYGRVSERDGSVILGVAAAEVGRWTARVASASFQLPVVVRGEANIGVVYEALGR